MVLMLDPGLLLTRLAIRRQLEAMPHDVFLIRLIHHATRRAFPGERLWNATQLTSVATIRFLRIRNREGCDVYFQPYAKNQNAGYILVDLDGADAAIVRAMRVQGHEPCVVLQTSPGHFQAWLHISPSPLEPSLATAVGKHMARTYGGHPPRAHLCPPLPPSTWLPPTPATPPVPAGVIWEGWPDSPTRSLSDAAPMAS